MTWDNRPGINAAMEKLQAESARLRAAVAFVVETFEKDEARGYHTKDRQFAISILRKALDGNPEQRSSGHDPKDDFSPENDPFQQSVKILCSACDATGKIGREEGPAGATWTVYEKCKHCDGRGYHVRIL